MTEPTTAQTLHLPHADTSSSSVPSTTEKCSTFIQLCTFANSKDCRISATSRSVFIIIAVFGLNINPIVLRLRHLLTTVKYESDVNCIAESGRDGSCEAASTSEITNGGNSKKTTSTIHTGQHHINIFSPDNCL